MVRWVGAIPAAVVCSVCDRLFMVPVESLKRVAHAQWSLNLQFDEHNCKRDDSLAIASLVGSRNKRKVKRVVLVVDELSHA